MTARVLASYNLKGGVGKTAAAVNLAYAAAQRGNRVLVWDLDPQGAASFYFRIKPKVSGGAKDLVRRRTEIADFIKASNYERLDLMPADFSYRNLDLYLGRKKKTVRRLRELLAPVGEDYEYIILDCPPGLSLASVNVFYAVDALLVPVIPTPLSALAYERIKGFIGRRDDLNVRLLPFFSLVDRRRRLHLEEMARFAAVHPETLQTGIAYSYIVELMGEKREPLQAFAPGSDHARAFDGLWKELVATLAA